MKSNSKLTHPLESTLHEYLDGELAQEEIETMKAHLDVCEECVQKLAAWQSVFQTIESLPEIKLVRNLAVEVLPRLRSGSETARVLYLILAEAALGTTLGFILWPQIRTWFDAVSDKMSSSLNTGLLQAQHFFSSLLEPISFWQLDWSGLKVESLLGENFWLPMIIVALVILILGNGIVLKTTQTNHQRRM